MILVIDKFCDLSTEETGDWIIGNLVSSLIRNGKYGKNIVLFSYNSNYFTNIKELDPKIAICGHGAEQAPTVGGMDVEEIIENLNLIYKDSISNIQEIDLFSCHTGKNGVANKLFLKYPSATITAPVSQLLPIFTGQKIEWHIVKEEKEEDYKGFQSSILNGQYDPNNSMLNFLKKSQKENELDLDYYLRLADDTFDSVKKDNIYGKLIAHPEYFYPANESCIFRNKIELLTPNQTEYGDF